MICQYSFSISEDKHTFFYRYHYWFSDESDTYSRTFIAAISNGVISHYHKDGKRLISPSSEKRLHSIENQFIKEVTLLSDKLERLHALFSVFRLNHLKINEESYELRGLEQVLFFTIEGYEEFVFEMHMTERKTSGLYLNELCATFDLVSVEDFCNIVKKSSIYRLRLSLK